jgi:CBS domain-containing protein
MDDASLDDLLPDDAFSGMAPSPGALPVSSLIAGEVRRTTPDATLYEVAARLTEEGIGALVVDDGGDGEDEAIAVVTERDLIRALADLADPAEVKVHQVASSDLVWCDAEATVAEVAELMAERYLRHVLVEQDGDLLGIVSARDLLGVYAASEDLAD